MLYSRPVPEPTSYVSVDVLALRFDRSSRVIRLGIHRRASDPYAGELALPGVLLLRGERLAEAGARALAKIGVPVGGRLGEGQLVTFDEPHRDPRGPTLSIALWAVVDDSGLGADGVEWADLDDVPPLAFDHDRIVADCRPRLADLLWRDLAFSRGLTGEVFTAADALAIATSLTGAQPDRGNLNRTLAGLTGLRRSEERRLSSSGVGRPGVVWTWV